MRKTLLLFFFIFYTNVLLQVHAQNVQLDWVKQMGSPAREEPGSIVTDAAGNVYTTGVFHGLVDFDPGPGVAYLNSFGRPNVYIQKLDAAGNLIWVKQLEGDWIYDYHIAIAPQGYLYLCGQFTGTMDADPGPDVHNLYCPNLAGIYSYILKLDLDGNFIWAKELDGENPAFNQITIDEAGNFYGAGFFKGTTDFDPGPGIYNLSSVNGEKDMLILKLDTDGNFIWAKQIGSAGDEEITSVAVDAAQNVYCSGSFGGTLDFDPGPGVFNLTPINSPFNTAVFKLDINGNFIWARQFNQTIGVQQPLKIVAGKLVIAGEFKGTIDLDPGPGTANFTALGTVDAFIIELDENSNLVWADRLGGTGSTINAKAISTDQLQNIYFHTNFSGNVDFDPGPAAVNLASSNTYDFAVTKFNGAGNFLWAKQIGGTGDNYALLKATVDAPGNIYTNGSFSGTADFDPGPATYNLTSAGGQDIFIQKLSPCLNKSYSTITATSCEVYTLNGYTYNSTGTYTQTLLNSNQCDSIITVNLTILGKTFTDVNPVICQGQSYFAGGSNQTASGIYKDTLHTTFGCDSIITTHLNVLPSPKPDLGPDRNICAATTLSLSPGTFDNYTWQDNSTQSTFTVNSTGKYWVTVSSSNTCSAADTINILAVDTVPVHFLPPGQQLCYGTALTIAVPGYRDYLWSNGQITNIVTLSSFGKFYLTVTDFNNCKGKDSITLVRKDCIPIGIPNAFTPNGDAKNDVFKPTINQDIRNYSFMVYNRYGEKIFDTKSYGTGWDGTYKGKAQPIGTYVYHIVYTNIFGIVSDNKGTVLLLR